MENQKKKNNGCLIVIMLFVGLIFGMSFCFLSTLFIGLFVGGSDTYNEEILVDGEVGKIVVIDVKGEIVSESGSSSLLSSEIASTQVINAQIQTAIEDSDVVGIILEMNSPGGDVVASDMIYDQIKEAQNAGLIVITSMQTLAASGGYYIASASDYIFANEMTTTGSIGVYSVYQDVSGLYEKLGIEQRIIKSGDYKTGAGLFDEDNGGAEDQIYQDIVDSAHKQFKEIVSRERGIPMTKLDDIADGRIFTGNQALANGLIDGIGTLDDSILQIESWTGLDDVTVVKYYSDDFFSSFLSVFQNNNLESLLYNLAKTEEGTKLMYKMP